MSNVQTAADMFAAMDQDPWAEAGPQVSPVGPGRLATAEAVTKYIMAGNATLTLRSVKTGQRFTYKVTRKKGADPGPRGPVYFVSLLVGSDNESSYKYLGHIFETQMVYWHGRKSKIGETAPAAKAFTWFWQQLSKRQLPGEDVLEVWHEGSCGRCGRKLTVPESVASGFGPECIQHVGH